MSDSKRRTTAAGNPMLVDLPVTYGKDFYDRTNHEYYNTGEGGLAFFFLVGNKRDFDERRQVCIAGDIIWPRQDVVINRKWRVERDTAIDAGLLIGSTGLSLWSDAKGSYFTPTYDELTPDGKALYVMLQTIYGQGSVDIVTLLDT